MAQKIREEYLVFFCKREKYVVELRRYIRNYFVILVDGWISCSLYRLWIR